MPRHPETGRFTPAAEFVPLAAVTGQHVMPTVPALPMNRPVPGYEHPITIDMSSRPITRQQGSGPSRPLLSGGAVGGGD